MARQVACPRCKESQELGEKCVKCGLDFRAYARARREAAEKARSESQAESSPDPGEHKPRREITCPKCGARQPLAAICTRCRFNIKTYVLRMKAQRQGAESNGLPPPGASRSSGPQLAPPGLPGLPQMPVAEEGPQPPPSTAPRRPAAGATLAPVRTIERLFGDTLAVYKNRVWVLLILYVLCVLIPLGAGLVSAAAFIVPGLFMGAMMPWFIGAGVMAGTTVAMLAGCWIWAAMLYAASDDRVTVRIALTNGRRRLWAFLWLFSIVGYMYLGGLLLFVFPLMLFMFYFAFAGYILATEDVGGMDAMLKSRDYIRGQGWNVLGKLLVIWFLGMIVSGIPILGFVAALFFFPFSLIYKRLIYEDLRATWQGSDEAYPAPMGRKFRWLALGTLGYVLLPLILAGLLLSSGLLSGDTLSFIKAAISQATSGMARDAGLPVGGGDGDEGFDAGGIGPDGEIAPYEYEKLVGRWRGMAGSEGWVFDFHHDRTVRVSAPSGGEYYEAWVAVYMGLGVPEGQGFIKVPPGAAMLDFKVTGGTAQEAFGKISLGVYQMRMDKEMTLCASEPGNLVRPDEFKAGAGIRCMELEKASGASAPPGAAASGGAGVRVSTGKKAYKAYEPIDIEYSGLPGGERDWITLVEASAPDTQFGSWFYTGGKGAGRHEFEGQAVGEYEVRVYFNWPDGGYDVKYRHALSVVEGWEGALSAGQRQNGGAAVAEYAGRRHIGSASVSLDNRSGEFYLTQGFGSDTDLASTSRMRLDYKLKLAGGAHSQESIGFILDSYGIGDHVVDGREVSDDFMKGYANVRVGQPTDMGQKAVFYYVAEGGQVFFPKTRCQFTLSSLYMGDETSVLRGRMNRCELTSAGIDKWISVTFDMKQAPR